MAKQELTHVDIVKDLQEKKYKVHNYKQKSTNLLQKQSSYA